MPKFSLVAAAACLVLSTAAFAVDDPSWPTYQSNTTHTGFIDRDLSTPSTEFAWQVTPQPSRAEGIAVGAGNVYVTPNTYFNGDAAFVALALDDGREIWRKTYPGIFSVNPPAYDQASGTVLIQTGNHGSDTYLRAYDAATGAFRWRSNHQAQWERYLAPTVIDGNAYINGGYYGGAYSFSLGSGMQNWFTSLQQYDNWTPTQLGADRLITYTNRIAVLDRASGLPLFEIIDPDYSWGGYDVGQTPIVVGDLAIVVNAGSLVAYDLVARNVAWKRAINAVGQVSTDGSQLFVVSAGTLSARSITDGTLLWAVEPPTGNFVAPFIVFREHIAISGAASTYLINRRTRDIDAAWPVAGKLAYGDDHLIVGESTGRVSAIHLRSTPLMNDSFE